MSKDRTPDELFVKSFSAYSLGVLVLWFMKKYEYSEFIEGLPPILMFIIGMPTAGPPVLGVFFGGIGSVISMLILTMSYFSSLHPQDEKVKWYYQLVSFACTFVFGWILYQFGATIGLSVSGFDY